jgi:hypothetical protein
LAFADRVSVERRDLEPAVRDIAGLYANLRYGLAPDARKDGRRQLRAKVRRFRP